MKVAIVHYWFITRRGGEKVVESILKLYPEADIYTLFYDQETYGDHLAGHKIYTSILNNRLFRKYYQKLFPLYPLGIKSLKLREDYDLIISSESGPAKGIKIKTRTPHICYIHSPMRYAWSHQEMYISAVSSILRPLLRFFLKRLKKWDISTIDNVGHYVANSSNVADRVERFYHRDAEVIYPPIEEDLFVKPHAKDKKRFYLSFGAITPYKKIDLLVETFNKNGKHLVIIGEGSEKEKLIKKAKDNIEFKSCPSWEDVEINLMRSRALLFPGEEDFGMIPLEVMAHGVPVIAYGKGGALETVVENRDKVGNSTGIFFEHQTIASVQNAIEEFEKLESSFDPNWIVNHSKKFKESEFLKKFNQSVRKFMGEFNT